MQGCVALQITSAFVYSMFVGHLHNEAVFQDWSSRFFNGLGASSSVLKFRENKLIRFLAFEWKFQDIQYIEI